MYTEPFVTLRNQREGNAPKNRKPTVGLSPQFCKLTISFRQIFLNKEPCDNTGASPMLLACLQLNFTFSLDWNLAMNGRRFYDATDLLRMRRTSWK